MRALAVLVLFAAVPAVAQEKERAEFSKQIEAAPPAETGDAKGVMGAAPMRRANEAAGEILQKRMQESRPHDLQLLRDAAGADVVVVSGEYDRVQDVLRAVGVKHVVIPPSMLEKLDLIPTQTLMVNCPGHVGAAAVAKVRDFVSRGGYLVTTDWALGLTQRAFPGTIADSQRRTPNDVVAVQVKDKSEKLLQNMASLSQEPRWWLESSSWPVRVLDAKKVKVLLWSDEMQRKYGDGAVAVSFRWQDGKVLHMTSHFYLQQGKSVAAAEKKPAKGMAPGVKASLDGVTAGELSSAYSMQQLSANLLVDKQEENKKLIAEKYKGTVVEDDVPLAAGKSGPRLKRDYRVEVLEEKDGKKKVRDLFGHEGWVDAAAVK